LLLKAKKITAGVIFVRLSICHFCKLWVERNEEEKIKNFSHLQELKIVQNIQRLDRTKTAFLFLNLLMWSVGCIFSAMFFYESHRKQ
jgi:hypothetical protein